MYIYEKYNFRVIFLISALFCVILMVVGQYWLTIPPGIVAILTAFSKTGIHIDPENKRYRQYDSFAGFYLGRWKRLPGPRYVSLVRVILSARRSQPTAVVMPDDKQGVKSYRVNLVVDDDDLRVIPVCRGSLEKMKEEALKLGKKLDLRVLDISTSEKKWML